METPTTWLGLISLTLTIAIIGQLIQIYFHRKLRDQIMFKLMVIGGDGFIRGQFVISIELADESKCFESERIQTWTCDAEVVSLEIWKAQGFPTEENGRVPLAVRTKPPIRRAIRGL